MDFPQGNKFTFHLLSVFAEYERDQISERTKNALAEAKRRGVKLGTHGKLIQSKVNKRAAQDFAKSLEPQITTLMAQGHVTVRAITDELNRLKVPTRQGIEHRWHLATVHRLLQRCF